MMRDFILLYVNGKRHQISDFRASLLLSDFLRNHLGLTGTKVVCGEGACGACSVLVGQLNDDNGETLFYHTANACLLRVFQMDGCHVITVEGLTEADNVLSSVQQAVVLNHGTQCGYCTPGMVISLTALRQNTKIDSDHETACLQSEGVRDALSGNLCRCTGYLPIQEAGVSLVNTPYSCLSDRYPEAGMREDFKHNAEPSARIGFGAVGNPVLIARTLFDALAYLWEFPHAVIIAGGTGVLPSSYPAPSDFPVLSIGALRELGGIQQRGNELFVGATVTWARLRQEAKTRFPELGRLLEHFGSPQIRNRGTIGGSVAQAEYNSDWLPLLLVQDAFVHLASAQRGERLLPFATFLSEKCTPRELLIGITTPLPLPEERLRLYKVTRRQAFDRSVFCAAVKLQITTDGEVIAAARIACGGVGPKPQRLTQTEQFLVGAPYTEETMRQAGSIAATEITPTSDAYAGADYRRQLAARLLSRFYHDGGDTTGTEENKENPVA